MSRVARTFVFLILLVPSVGACQAEMLTYDRVPFGNLGPTHDFRSIATTANCWVSADTLFLADSVGAAPADRIWLWTGLGDRPLVLTDSIRDNETRALPLEITRFCPGGEASFVGTYKSTEPGVPFRGMFEVSGYTRPDR